MSTRSRINYVQEDGTYKSIYCHFDGYPSHNGYILYKHYTTLESVKALVELGDMSSLAETVENSIFYMRDREEENVPAIVTDEPTGEAYSYVFKDGKWSVAGFVFYGYIPLESLYDVENDSMRDDLCDE